MLSFMDLDPESSFYRICPRCGKAHMVNNRGRDYCSEKCYQDHYNNFRKKLRDFKLFDTESMENKSQSTYTPPKPNKDMEAQNRNIQIFKELLDNGSKAYLSIYELDRIGFDFFAFSYHYPLDEKQLSFCIEYGPLKTILTNPSTILVTQFENNNDNL